MTDGYRLAFTIVGILILAAAVLMAAAKRGDGGALAVVKIGPFSLEVTGFGASMAAVGLAAMTIPWLLPDAVTILDARDHPISEFQICTAPQGTWAVVDSLPAGPLNVRTGAGTQYLEINALGPGTGGLRFDQCVQRHGGATPWWRIDGSGWLFSKYVERS